MKITIPKLDKVTAEQKILGAEASRMWADGEKTPPVIVDASLWESCKSAVLKARSIKDDNYWPLVCAAYDLVGGEVEVQSVSVRAVASKKAVVASGLAMSIVDAPNRFMYMPKGIHTIHASRGGKPIRISVKVEPKTAQKLQASLDALKAERAPNLPYFDFQHREEEAAFRPNRFEWDAQAGVMVSGEWTGDGRAKVENKTFQSFSPSFHPDREPEDTSPESPAEVAAMDYVGGGLVNKPAFRKMSPLWSMETEPESSAADGHKCGKCQADMKVNAEFKLYVCACGAVEKLPEEKPVVKTSEPIINVTGKITAAQVQDSINRIRELVRGAMEQHEHYKAKPVSAEPNAPSSSRYWLSDVLVGKTGAPWNAIIEDNKSGKLLKHGFTFDDNGGVKFADGDATEVELTYANESSLFTGTVLAGDLPKMLKAVGIVKTAEAELPAHDFGGNKFADAPVSRIAYAATNKARSENTSKAHEAAAEAHGKAADHHDSKMQEAVKEHGPDHPSVEGHSQARSEHAVLKTHHEVVAAKLDKAEKTIRETGEKYKDAKV
jgi:hypothetical protein